jgi:TonB family protein
MSAFFTPLGWQRVALGVAALAFSLLARAASAQAPAAMPLTGTDPTLTAHTSARFPGGPDSLQAVLGRLTRAAHPAQSGQVFLFVLFDKRLRRRKPEFLKPAPGTPEAALVRDPEVQALARQLTQQLPSWEPGPGETGRTSKQATAIILPLSFGTAPAAPLAYSDDNPTFPLQTIRTAPGVAVPAPNLSTFIRSQVSYPQQALINRERGQAYAYFEVTETGTIENARVVGSVGPSVDAEILRVLRLIPPALTPPRQKGQPARVFYIQPFKFKFG